MDLQEPELRVYTRETSKNAYNSSAKDPKGINHFEDLGVDGRVLLKQSLKTVVKV